MAYRYNSNHQDNNRPKKRLRRFFGIVAVLMAVLLVLCAYAGKFNPEKFEDVNIEQATKDFYLQFYGYQLTDDEVSRILNGENPA